MAPLTSSFIVDVEEAVLAEIRRVLGDSSTVYPEPAYLQLVYAERGEVVPRLEINEAKLPGLLMQYVAGAKQEGGLGCQVNRERWNAGAVLRLTPAIMGCAGADLATFRKYAHASADTLRLRLRKLLMGFKPNVTDAVFGETTGRGWVSEWGIIPTYRSDFEVVYAVLCDYSLTTEMRTRA